MPRHTPAYAMAVLLTPLVALTMPLVSTAHAQLPPSKYDNLQRTLEDKFSPKKMNGREGGASATAFTKSTIRRKLYAQAPIRADRRNHVFNGCLFFRAR